MKILMTIGVPIFLLWRKLMRPFQIRRCDRSRDAGEISSIGEKAISHIRSAVTEDDMDVFFHSTTHMLGIAKGDRWIKVNPAFMTVLGYTEEECLKYPFSFWLHPDDVDRSYAEAAKMLGQNGKSVAYEARSRHKDGHYVWISWSAQARNGLLYGVGVEIDDRKRAEQEAREKNAQLNLALEATEVGVWDWDATHDVLQWDETMYRIFGIAEGKTMTQYSDFNDTLHPDDRGMVEKHVAASLKKGDQYKVEYRVVRSDGEARTIAARGEVIRDETGTIQRFIGVCLDITETRNVQEELQQSNAFLDSVIEHLPNMVFVKDAQELRFVRFNKAGEELLGYDSDDLIGKNDYDFFPQEQADFFTEKYKKVLQGKNVVDISEEPIETREKGERILHTKKIPILDADGDPEYLLGISEDITDKKEIVELRETKDRLQQEMRNVQKFHQAVDASADAILIIDTKGKIVYANPAWEELTGFTEEEVLGKTTEDINRDASTPELKDRKREALRSGEEFRADDVLFRRKDGSEYLAEQTIFPIKEDDTVQFYVSIHHNITQRKRSDEAKVEFVSLASHQLRTPLTAIRWAIGIMQKDLSEHLDRDQQEMVDTAHDAAVRMAETIRAMLTISRIEAGQESPNCEEVQLQDVIETVRKEVHQSAESKHQDFTIECSDITISSDKKFLTEIIMNLTTNAIRYTPANGTVRIKAQQEDGRVAMTVTDTGCGIPIDEQGRMFTRFFRARNAQALEPDGSGLGLYLVSLLVNMLDGDIDFQSKEDEGTTFTVALPLQPDACRLADSDDGVE